MAPSLPSEVRPRRYLGAAALVLALVLTAGPAFAAPAQTVIEGTARADRLQARDRPALIRALAGDDQVAGGPAADRLEGAGGADLLQAGPGDDALFGGRGADRLEGGGGADRLSGDRDDDILVGGSGADQFVFAAGHGDDRILDFASADGDRIVLPDGYLLQIAEEGGAAVITGPDGSKVRLDGVPASEMGEWRAAAHAAAAPAQAAPSLALTAGLVALTLAMGLALGLAPPPSARSREAAPSTAVRLVNLAVLCLGTAVLLYGLYPGRLDSDSGWMYDQAADLSKVNDWHSPLLTAFMAASRRLMPGSGPLFVLQLLTWAGGLLLLSEGLIRNGRRWAGLLITLLCVNPLISFELVEVNKDAAMAATGMLLIGLIVRAALKQRAPSPAGHLGLAVVAVVFLGMRFNALIALAPLLAAYVLGVVRPPRASLAPWGALAVGIFAALLALDSVQKYAVLDAKRMHSGRTLVVFDLAGVTRYADAPVATELLGPGFQPQARACYAPQGQEPFEWGECAAVGARMAELSRSAEGRARIRAAWLEAVREHPLAYLRHRWAALDQLLRIGCANCESVMTAGVQLERRPGIVERIDPVGVALERAAWPMYRSALGRGVLWVAALAACLIALGLRLHRGRDPLAAVTAGVALSGLAYTLAFAVIGVGSAMRYVHWAVMLGAIAVPLTISILRSPLPPRTPASGRAEGG